MAPTPRRPSVTSVFASRRRFRPATPARRLDLGLVRRMTPLLALQAFLGPIFFHLMTKPFVDEVIGLQVATAEAVENLVAVAIAGLAPAAVLVELMTPDGRMAKGGEVQDYARREDLVVLSIADLVAVMQAPAMTEGHAA